MINPSGAGRCAGDQDKAPPPSPAPVNGSRTTHVNSEIATCVSVEMSAIGPKPTRPVSDFAAAFGGKADTKSGGRRGI